MDLAASSTAGVVGAVTRLRRFLAREQMLAHDDGRETGRADLSDAVVQGHAAIPAVASNSRRAASSLPRLCSVAPIGSGFFSESFQRLKVVGCTPAFTQIWRMETWAASARASMSAMTVCWSIAHA